MAKRTIQKKKKITVKSCFKIVKNFVWKYKFTILIATAYALVMANVISWGLPNQFHPFPYHMDESHQLQAVRTVIKYGTSNYPHQENGPMFHYVMSAFLVSPFVLLKIINPFAISSAISSPEAQQGIYIAFRGVVVLFGVLSIFLLAKISKLLKIAPVIAVLLFVITPVWIVTSGVFKYDIPFLFWTLLTVLAILNYSHSRTDKNFILVCISTGLAISTKITGIPLVVLSFISFFYFTEDYKKHIPRLIKGIGAFILVFCLVGIPDIIFFGRSMSEYLYYNIVLNPKNDREIILGMSNLEYKLRSLLPVIFGYFFMGMAYISVLYLVGKIIIAASQRRFNKVKLEAFILFALFLFSVSFVPLWVIASNRAIIILPFLVFIIGFFIKDLAVRYFKYLNIFLAIFVFGIGFQFFQTYSWYEIKLLEAPQVTASKWMNANLAKGSLIGIENVPVYQMLPDLVIKDFYDKEYDVKRDYRFKYEIIDINTQKLPKYIILSNAQFDKNNKMKSIKKDLLNRLYREGYSEISGFSPQSQLYSFFTDDVSFVTSGMSAVPLRISVFEKSN